MLSVPVCQSHRLLRMDNATNRLQEGPASEYSSAPIIGDPLSPNLARI